MPTSKKRRKNGKTKSGRANKFGFSGGGFNKQEQLAAVGYTPLKRTEKGLVVDTLEWIESAVTQAKRMNMDSVFALLSENYSKEEKAEIRAALEHRQYELPVNICLQ